MKFSARLPIKLNKSEARACSVWVRDGKNVKKTEKKNTISHINRFSFFSSTHACIWAHGPLSVRITMREGGICTRDPSRGVVWCCCYDFSRNLCLWARERREKKKGWKKETDKVSLVIIDLFTPNHTQSAASNESCSLSANLPSNEL